MYKIKYTKNAIDDLDSIYNYISSKFHAPDTAQEQVQRIRDKISTLKNFPMRHHARNNLSWKKSDLRVFPVDNYNVLYVVDEKKTLIRIMRILYCRVDINSIFINPNS